MATIDPTTVVGKLRLMTGDTGDLPFLTDAIYTHTYTDQSNNYYKAAVVCGQYILAMLTQSTRSKLYQVESWDSDAFKQYKEYLIQMISNPALSNYNPRVFTGGATNENPLIQFGKSWNYAYTAGTSTEDMDAYAGGTATVATT